MWVSSRQRRERLHSENDHRTIATITTGKQRFWLCAGRPDQNTPKSATDPEKPERVRSVKRNRRNG
jgi:hypothetical protein